MQHYLLSSFTATITMWSRMGAGNHTPDCYQMGAPFATPVKNWILCRKSPSPQQAIVLFLHVHGLPISNQHIQEHPSMSEMHIRSHHYSIKIPSLVYTGAYLYPWLCISFPLLLKLNKPPKTNNRNPAQHLWAYWTVCNKPMNKASQVTMKTFGLKVFHDQNCIDFKPQGTSWNWLVQHNEWGKHYN